jgi:hypothetical protein
MQASRELGCPASDVALTPLTGRVYQVVGCGQLRDYEWGLGARRGWHPLEPVYVRAATEMACPLPYLQILAPTPTIRHALGCGQTARYDLVCSAIVCQWAMTAREMIGAGGSGPGVAASVAPSAPATVVDGASAASPSTQLGVSTDGALPDSSASANAVAALESEASTDDLVIPNPPAPGSPEALLRTAIDARREGIRRCVGGGPVAIRAAWSEDGSVTIGVEAPHGGTQAETCVRSLVRLRRVPAGRPAGEIVHTIF